MGLSKSEMTATSSISKTFENSDGACLCYALPLRLFHDVIHPGRPGIHIIDHALQPHHLFYEILQCHEHSSGLVFCRPHGYPAPSSGVLTQLPKAFCEQRMQTHFKCHSHILVGSSACRQGEQLTLYMLLESGRE